MSDRTLLECCNCQLLLLPLLRLMMMTDGAAAVPLQ
jgi:hypothetical protein